MMIQGGNRQFRLFLESLDIHNPPIEVLYHSKAASLYRAKLRRQVENTLNGIAVGVTIAQSLELNHHAHVDPWASHHERQLVSRYAVLFPEGQMGMTVTKDPADNRAYVSRIVEGGAADRGGVQVGDYVDGVAGKYISDFDIVMHMIPLMPRPVQLIISRVMKPSEPLDIVSDDIFSSPEQSPFAHGMMHTNSSPSLSHDDTHASSNQHLPGSPRRRRKKQERVRIAVLRSDSMMAGEHDSDTDDSGNNLQSAFPSKFSLKTLSASLESGIVSAKSTPSKSPRHRQRYLSSNSDEVRSDSESVYFTPNSLLRSAHRRRRAVSPPVAVIGDNIAVQDYSDLFGSALIAASPYIDPTSEDAHETSVPESNIMSCSLVKKPVLASGSGDVPGLPISNLRRESTIVRSSSEPPSQDVQSSAYHDFSSDGKRLNRACSGEYILRLKRGLVVRVFNAYTEKWGVGSIQRQHRDGTFKIRFDDGHAEPHVASDRIAIAREMLRSISSFASSFESARTTSTSSPRHDPGLPRQSSGGDVDISTHSRDSHKSNTSRESTRDWLDRVKSGKEIDSKIEFLVEYPGDEDDWIGDSGTEDETDVARKTSEQVASKDTGRSKGNSNLEIVDSQYSDVFQVLFPNPPMGFSLNKSSSGHAHVTKITPGGQASCSPIRLGDCVIEINGISVNGYNDFMKSMLTVTYPAHVKFLRRKRSRENLDQVVIEHVAAASASSSPQMRREDVMLPDAYKQLVEETSGMQHQEILPKPANYRAYSEPSTSKFSALSSSPVATKLLMDKPPTARTYTGILRDVCFSEV